MDYKLARYKRIMQISNALKKDPAEVESKLNYSERKARERAGGKCEKCHKYPINHIHHIKRVKYFPELFDSVDNLICLCLSCHQGEHPNIDLGIIPYPNYGHNLDEIFSENKIFYFHPELISEYECIYGNNELGQNIDDEIVEKESYYDKLLKKIGISGNR